MATSDGVPVYDRTRSGTVTYGLTLVLAFCSITYELLLAQTLTATMGGALIRYNITIGLYVAALGAGTWLSERGGKREGASFDTASHVRRLVRVEVVLALLGGAGSSLVLMFDRLLQSGLDPSGFGYTFGVYLFNHGLVIAIGILSGFELPMLMALGDHEQEKEGGDIRVLATDFFGTLLGAVAFPLLLLPALGVFGVGFLTAALNALTAVVLAGVYRARAGVWTGLAVILCLALTWLLFEHGDVQRLMVEQFYLGG